MVDIAIRPANPDALTHIARHMRVADRQEIWAAGHRTPIQALERAARLSNQVWVGCAAGEPGAVWGVAPASLLGETGIPWLLGTDLIERHAVAFLRGCRGALDDLQRGFLVLRNLVDARNGLALRWLRWLGFTIEPAVSHGPEGLPFHPFWRQVDV